MMNGKPLYGVTNQNLSYLRVMVKGGSDGNLKKYNVECLVPTVKSVQQGVMFRESRKLYFSRGQSSIHTARVVKNWKDENDTASLPWPAQSPDLNPIENLWDELDRQVRAHRPLPTNRESLCQILREKWSNIDAGKYQNLVDSMPRRVAAVINNKGHPTKY
ncbi:unnamed protein product [Rhizophagus irregularis]|nr:unnamed protein product [Rhizophagus irregularis]